MRYGEIEKNGIVNLDRSWSNNIPKADVYLNGDTRSVNNRIGLDADAAVFEVFSDGRCGNTVDIKDNTIVWDDGRADVFESIRYRLRGIGAITEEIQVSRWTERIGNPRYKKQCTLEDKAFTMFRDTKSIEQSLQSITSEKDLVVGVFRS